MIRNFSCLSLGLADLGRGGLEGFSIFLLISLSWYCDCAVEEAVEAEPLEAVGDDILFRCRFVRDEEGKVRSGPCEDGRCV